MEYVYGFLGALSCLLLWGGGFLLGWAAHKHRRCVTAERLTEKEQHRIKEEQEAWHRLHNYSVEDAYRLHAREGE